MSEVQEISAVCHREQCDGDLVSAPGELKFFEALSHETLHINETTPARGASWGRIHRMTLGGKASGSASPSDPQAIGSEVNSEKRRRP